MAGKLLKAWGDGVGKLPVASAYNTIEAREEYFAGFPEGAACWWTDDEFECYWQRRGGEYQVAPPGVLPNKVCFAPFDWPRKGMLLKTPRVVRLIMSNTGYNDNNNVFWPGDADLDTLIEISIGSYYLFNPARFLFNEWASAIAEAVAGTDVLFVIHQPFWTPGYDGGSCSRWLRALGPWSDDAFVGGDILNLVFLYNHNVEEYWTDFDAGEMSIHYLPWNGQDYGANQYAEIDSGHIYDPPHNYNYANYVGLNPMFDMDIPKLIDAYPWFDRMRTVMYDDHPGMQGVTILPGPVVNRNEQNVYGLTQIPLNNAMQLEETAERLGDYGVEYGGQINVAVDSPAAVAALVKSHFGLT